jgi:DNA polymerase III delta prime subunit
MAGLFFKRTQEILKNENVQSNDSVVAEVIKKYFPDFRRILNELQRYSKFDNIDEGILSTLNEDTIKNVITLLKEKDLGGIRKWLANNDYESSTLYRKLFDSLYEEVVPHYAPLMILSIADYQYKRAFVADGQLNDLALLTQIMMEAEFKK